MADRTASIIKEQ